MRFCSSYRRNVCREHMPRFHRSIPRSAAGIPVRQSGGPCSTCCSSTSTGCLRATDFCGPQTTLSPACVCLRRCRVAPVQTGGEDGVSKYLCRAVGEIHRNADEVHHGLHHIDPDLCLFRGMSFQRNGMRGLVCLVRYDCPTVWGDVLISSHYSSNTE